MRINVPILDGGDFVAKSEAFTTNTDLRNGTVFCPYAVILVAKFFQQGELFQAPVLRRRAF